MVPDGAITQGQSTFRSHHEEGLQALLKPVSQVRILPGAPSEQRRCNLAQDLHNRGRGVAPNRLESAMTAIPTTTTDLANIPYPAGATHVAEWDDPRYPDPTAPRYFRGTLWVIDRTDDPYNPRPCGRDLGDAVA
jgi:hypothetical protein